MNNEVLPGQRWRDEMGEVRVLAVGEGYAMLKRRRRNPFVASVAQMLRGEYGWQLCEDGHPVLDDDAHCLNDRAA